MNSTNTQLCQFALNVQKGLLSNPRMLPSMYFYDDIGSRIFQEIMEMPEYYLTDAEMEILSTQPAQIYAALDYHNGFNIVELGAGDGVKTKALLSHLVSQRANVTYYPLDISQEAMSILETDLANTLPSLAVSPLVGDYFKVLDQIDLGDRPNFFLFLGSNIGNYEPSDAIQLLKHFGKYMKPGDQLLLGFDLKKHPRKIRNAYDDPNGITARFNLNLLNRMNRELGANFDLDSWEFYANYDPKSGDVRSYLISLCEQKVQFSSLNQSFIFEKDELINTELSKKYSLAEMTKIAQMAGFAQKDSFMDKDGLFMDGLFVKQ